MHKCITFIAVAISVALLSTAAEAVRVGAVQMVSHSGATYAETALLNARQIVNISAGHSPSNNVPQPLDLITFPEFELYGSSNPMAKCTTPGANGWAAFCEPIPAAGSYVNCNSTADTPLTTVACSGPQDVTISYNACEKFLPSVNATRYKYFNTQVVVRGGQVLARYRKRHVYDTKCFDIPELELVTFKTGGETFGVFTCFDIMFPDPKEALVKQGVKYFSYSSAIPLVARDAVRLFSFLNHVNVVSSNMQLGQSSVITKGHAVAECADKHVIPCVAVADI